MSAFSYDLGEFDPNYLGITQHFPNEAIWRERQEMMNTIREQFLADLVTRNPQLSRNDITMETLARYMQDSKLENPLTKEEKEELGQALIERLADHSVAYLAVGSAYEHERRHFHDWFIMPYAAELTAIRAEVCENAYRVYLALHVGGTNVIPVPVTRWLRKTEAEKAELLQMWQSLIGAKFQIRVPTLRDPSLVSAIENIERRYKSSLQAFFESIYHVGVSPSAIFEASALLIQMQAIHDLYGSAASNLFFNTMLGQDERSRYPLALRVLARAASSSQTSLENNTLSAAIIWCLLGRATTDRENSNPLTRLTHVVRYTQERGYFRPDASSRSIFEELDKASGVVPYTQCIEDSIRDTRAICKMMYDSWSSVPDPPGAVIATIQAYELYGNIHEYMARILLQDPDSYVKPTAYLDTNLERWPEPFIRETFGRPFYAVTREELKNYAQATPFETAGTEDTVFLRQLVWQVSDRSVVDLTIADNWLYVCSFADALFAEFNRDNPDIEFHRERKKKEGVYLLEVLS